jgi:hypothetical protein
MNIQAESGDLPAAGQCGTPCRDSVNAYLLQEQNHE